MEQVLGSRSTPLTAVRAGIIIGPGGSSFRIVKRLVQNLPIMACPKWTKSKNQPVDLRIALKSIEQIFGNEKFFNLPIEIGGSEIVTYMDILKITAKEMKRKRWIFSIPLFSLGMSKLWVGLFSGSNKNFVSPLIESLRHDMTLKTSISLKNLPNFTLKETIKRASDSTIAIPMAPKGLAQTKDKNTVRSVQRIANPARKTAEWVAQLYPIWLSKIFNKVIEAEEQNNLLKFKLLGITLLQLEHIKNRSDKNRQLFYITGGYLTKRTNRGWLEFRSILDDNYIITAIHEFVPRLPWFIYKFTQAKAHLLVMKKFEKHLNTMKK